MSTTLRASATGPAPKVKTLKAVGGIVAGVAPAAALVSRLGSAPATGNHNFLWWSENCSGVRTTPLRW